MGRPPSARSWREGFYDFCDVTSFQALDLIRQGQRRWIRYLWLTVFFIGFLMGYARTIFHKIGSRKILCTGALLTLVFVGQSVKDYLDIVSGSNQLIIPYPHRTMPSIKVSLPSITRFQL